MIIASGQPGRSMVWHDVGLCPAERRKRFGHVVCSPRRKFVAGEWITLRFTITIGNTELPEGGRLALAWTWPLDWTELQARDCAAAGFTTVLVESAGHHEAAHVEFQFFPQGSFDPWQHHLELTVSKGRLHEGDTLVVSCGDQSGGSQGWRVPTFRLKELEFVTLIDPERSDNWHRLPAIEGLSIGSGPPERLVALAPSEGVVAESATVILRAEDRWGNACKLDWQQCGIAELGEDPGNSLLAFGESVAIQEPPVVHIPVRFTAPGSTKVEARFNNLDLKALSNPIRIRSKPLRWQCFWGDLHSGQGEVGCGVGSVANHFTYARDAAGIQFISHQGNDHYVSRDLWDVVRRETEAFYEPEQFVTFLGCEWSAMTSAGGDRNVFYQQDETRLRRSGRFFLEDEPDPEPDLVTAQSFLDALSQEPVLINMHVGGRPTNLDWHAPEIEQLAEVHSTHGTSEWFIKDALSRGYRFGITAGTDGITGRPGACQPGWRQNRNVRNGLTAVYASDLTRDGIWEAILARRCYATSGERIGLWFEVNGQPMGSICAAAGAPEATIEVAGTAPLETVELLRNNVEIRQWRLAGPSPTIEGRNRIRLLWQGTAQRGTARAQRAIWGGSLCLAGGRIHTAEALNFQGGDDYLHQTDTNRIAWQNATAGNRAGVVLEIEGNAATKCEFESAQTSFSFLLAQVLSTPLAIAAGGMDCQVSVGPAPDETAPSRVSLRHSDHTVLPEKFAYWVRVTQIDQAQAWSSPVFFDNE